MNKCTFLHKSMGKSVLRFSKVGVSMTMAIQNTGIQKSTKAQRIKS